MHDRKKRRLPFRALFTCLCLLLLLLLSDLMPTVVRCGQDIYRLTVAGRTLTWNAAVIREILEDAVRYACDAFPITVIGEAVQCGADSLFGLLETLTASRAFSFLRDALIPYVGEGPPHGAVWVFTNREKYGILIGRIIRT